MSLESDKARTCTEVLMQAMEEFGESEAKAVVILFVDEAGDAVIMRNASNTQTIGLCEYGKESAMRRIFQDAP